MSYEAAQYSLIPSTKNALAPRGGLAFDGTASTRATSTLTNQAIGTDAFSVSVMVEIPSANPVSERGIFVLGSSVTSGDAGGSVQGYVTTGGILALVFRGVTSADYRYSSVSTSVVSAFGGKTVSIVMVRSTTTGLSVYINGVLQTLAADGTAGTPPAWTTGSCTSTYLTLGLGSSSGLEFVGKIYSASLYNLALAQSDVTEIYQLNGAVPERYKFGSQVSQIGTGFGWANGASDGTTIATSNGNGGGGIAFTAVAGTRTGGVGAYVMQLDSLGVGSLSYINKSTAGQPRGNNLRQPFRYSLWVRRTAGSITNMTFGRDSTGAGSINITGITTLWQQFSGIAYYTDGISEALNGELYIGLGSVGAAESVQIDDLIIQPISAVVYLPLEDGTGLTAYDASTNALNATLTATGVSWTKPVAPASFAAPALTPLTLSGGSTGATLVLGQGTSGIATLTSKGGTAVRLTGSDGGTGTSIAEFYNGSTVTAWVAGGGVFSTPRVSGTGTGLILASNAIGQPLQFFLASEVARFSTTNGNLLIGGTTDITGSGGLKIFGTTASTNTTSGALIVSGGVGVAGAGYFGSNVTASDFILGTSGPSVRSSIVARAPQQGLVFNGTTGTNATLTSAIGSGSMTYHTSFLCPSSVSDTGIICVGDFSTQDSLVIQTDSAGRVAFVLYTLGGQYSSYNIPSFIATYGGKNVTLTFTRSGTTITGFVNGVQVSLVANNSAVPPAWNTSIATTSVLVGKLQNANYYFNGIIYSALIYNRALSAAEVVTLYESGDAASADYNIASNTAIANAVFVGNVSGGASASAFTLTAASGTNYALSNLNASVPILAKGQRIRVTGTLTMNAGSTNYPLLYSDSVGSTSYTFTAGGAFSAEITVGSGLTTSGLVFVTNGAANYSVSGLVVTRIGLLLAPDAAQTGGGLTWYDTSGNAANITLPATGVAWNVPTSGNITSSSSVNLRAGGTNNNITLTPVGTGVNLLANSTLCGGNFNVGAGSWRSGALVVGIDGYDKVVAGHLVSSTNGAVIGAHNSAVASWSQLNVVGSTVVIRTNGEVEAVRVFANQRVGIGTGVTDSANGILQLASSTAATGGIGFGADTSIYRSAANVLTIQASSGAVCAGGFLSNTFTNSSGATMTVGPSTANSLVLRTNSTTALTIDSSQDAIFAGRVFIGNGATKGLTVNSGSGDSLFTMQQAGSEKWVQYLNSGSLVWFNSALASNALTLNTATNAATFAGALVTQAGGFRSSGSLTLGATFASIGAGFQIDYTAPVTTQFFGDGTGYSMVWATRAASATTARMTLTDAGALTVTGAVTASNGNLTVGSATTDSILTMRDSQAHSITALGFAAVSASYGQLSIGGGNAQIADIVISNSSGSMKIVSPAGVNPGSAVFSGAVTAVSTAAGGFGQVSITNNASAAINNYMLGSTYGGTTFGGVTGNNQAVIEASSAASSLYLGTGGGSSIVLAPNRTAALTLASGGAATFAGQGNFRSAQPQIVIGAGATAINQIGFIYSSGGQYFGLSGNRNPNSGIFVNTAGTHAGIDLDTGAAGSSITFRTTATPNALGNVMLTLASSGKAIFENAAIIQGLTVGLGGGDIISNMAIGNSALYSNTDGILNTAIGSQALYNNTIGNNNTAIGSQALYYSTDGNNNTAIGISALYNNTIGNNNAAIGFQALYGNTIGYSNFAIGTNALGSNTTGAANVAIGTNALPSNTTGTGNMAIGSDALYFNTTANGNTANGNTALGDIRPTSEAISAFADYSATVADTVRATSVGHGLTGTVTREITGTVNYNGSQSITVIDADSFYFTATFVETETGWWSVLSEGRNNTALGSGAGLGIVTGSGNTILGANVTDLAFDLTNNIILANGTGAIKARHDGTNWTLTGAVTSTGAITAPGVVLSVNTALFSADASLSSYSTTNGVYLNGHAAGWLRLSGSGGGVAQIQLNGGATGSITMKTATANAFVLNGTTGAATLTSTSYTTNIGLAPAASIVGAYQVTSSVGTETPVIGVGDGTRSGAIYGMQNGANISQFRFGHQQGSIFYESVKFYSGLTAATHVATFSGTTPSTLTTNGAVVVAGGVGIGGAVTARYLNSIGGEAFNQFGTGTRTKATLSGASGEVAFDNNTVDSPGVHFYIGNNANYGIDATSALGLRLVKNMDEAGGTVMASFTDTAATFASALTATKFNATDGTTFLSQYGSGVLGSVADGINVIASKGSVQIAIDIDNDQTSRNFTIVTNGASSGVGGAVGGGSGLLTMTETGNTTFFSVTSGVSTSSAAVIATSLGLSENLFAGGSISANRWETVTGTLTYSATPSVNFASSGLLTLTLTGNAAFNPSSNIAAGRGQVIRIVGDTVSRTLSFPAGWVFIGGSAPTSIAANKTGILSVTSFGTSDVGIIAAWSVQS